MFLDMLVDEKKSSLFLAATWEPTMPQTNNRGAKWRSWWASSDLFCPCGLERWWSSHKVGVHKEKLPSLFLSLLEFERGGDLLVEGPSEGGHHTSSQHSRGEALGKPTQPLFPAIFFRKLYFTNNLTLTCRWKQQQKRFYALSQAASVSSPYRPAETVQIKKILYSKLVLPEYHLSDQTGKEAGTKSCRHVSHLGRCWGHLGLPHHLLLQQVVEGEVEAGEGNVPRQGGT